MATQTEVVCHTSTNPLKANLENSITNFCPKSFHDTEFSGSDQGQERLSATTLKRFRPKLCYRVVYCVLLVTHNVIHELKRQGYVK